MILAALLAVACGGPPGEAVCRDFQRTIIQRQAQELSLFEYTDRIVRLGGQAQAAEPEILQAATHLAYSITTVSTERVEVAIVAMRDA